MEKHGEIRHDITPTEDNTKAASDTPLDTLEEHLTKRAADAAKDKLSEDNPSN